MYGHINITHTAQAKSPIYVEKSYAKRPTYMGRDLYIWKETCIPYAKRATYMEKSYAKRPIYMERDLHILESRMERDLYIWKEMYMYGKTRKYHAHHSGSSVYANKHSLCLRLYIREETYVPYAKRVFDFFKKQGPCERITTRMKTHTHRLHVWKDRMRETYIYAKRPTFMQSDLYLCKETCINAKKDRMQRDLCI